MNIKIQSRDFQLTEALHMQISAKLQLILSRYGHKIRKTEVILSDVNGPRGGVDKCCVMKFRINHLKTIVVKDTTSDMYESISNCALRVRRTLERQFGRDRITQRKIIPVLEGS